MQFEPAPDDASPDRKERILDFLARHGGAAQPAQRADQDPLGCRGWTETYAADGYTLRCDWSRAGSHEEMQFSELPPHARESHTNE